LSADPFYNTGRYKAWRDKVISRAGGLCEECRRYGRTDKSGQPIIATVAHHIKHVDEYPELRYRLDNGKALCAACHSKAHPEKGGHSWGKWR